MLVKNEYVTINTGKKSVSKHNYFLNDYLIYYCKGQLYDYTMLNLEKFFDMVFIKLDEPLEDPTRSGSVSYADFDLLLKKPATIQTGTNNQVSIIYNFNDDVFYYDRSGFGFEPESDKSLIAGRKITALSFDLKTFLDVSAHNIYIEEDTTLSISRKDTFTSDAICVGYDFPYHLAPKLDDYTYTDGGADIKTKIVAYIYSVGLGSIKGQMEEEYIIGDSAKITNIVEDEEHDIYSFDFAINKGGRTEIYPNGSLYPATTIHPLLITYKTSLYPNTELYCGSGLYPTKADYKYIMIKYRLGYIKYYGGSFDEIVDIDKEYVMNYYSSRDGLLTVTTKIERNESDE
jgi:hypothetical protein